MNKLAKNLILLLFTYLTFLYHNTFGSFIEDMIPPVKAKLISSIKPNLTMTINHNFYNNCLNSCKLIGFFFIINKSTDR